MQQRRDMQGLQLALQLVLELTLQFLVHHKLKCAPGELLVLSEEVLQPQRVRDMAQHTFSLLRQQELEPSILHTNIAVQENNTCQIGVVDTHGESNKTDETQGSFVR